MSLILLVTAAGMVLVFWVGSLLVQLPQTGTGSRGRLLQGSSVLMLSLVLPQTTQKPAL